MFSKINFSIHKILAIWFTFAIIVKLLLYYFYSSESEYNTPPEISMWLTFILVTSIWASEKNKALYIYLILTTLFMAFMCTEQALDFIQKSNSISKIIDAITFPIFLLIYIYLSIIDPWKVLYRYHRKKHNKAFKRDSA